LALSYSRLWRFDISRLWRFDISRLWRFPIRAFGALFRLFVQSQSAVLASANDPVLPEI
jgi:hypothetical protein